MIFVFNHFIKLKLIFTFIILIGCQLQEPSKNHGIISLQNRADKLQINISNTNDVIKIIGQPHTKSIENKYEWFYLERTLSKGEFHKLGQNVLKSNNILVLNFNKYGILKEKNLLTKKDLNKMNFSEQETENELTQKSFVEKFLSSIKSKMYTRL